MKIENNDVLPAPTPRKDALPGAVYEYTFIGGPVIAVRDEGRMSFDGEVFFVSLKTGECFSGDGGLLYPLDAKLVIQGKAR